RLIRRAFGSFSHTACAASADQAGAIGFNASRLKKKMGTKLEWSGTWKFRGVYETIFQRGSRVVWGKWRRKPRRFFYFFIFYFRFLQKIYFRFGNLQEYTPAALLPGGRDPTAR